MNIQEMGGPAANAGDTKTTTEQGNCITFSILTHNNPTGKTYRLDALGEITSETNGKITSAYADTQSIKSIAELKPIIDEMKINQHLVMGASDKAPIKVVGHSKSGAIQRTNKDLPFPKGPGVLVVDTDNWEGDEWPAIPIIKVSDRIFKFRGSTLNKFFAEQ